MICSVVLCITPGIWETKARGFPGFIPFIAGPSGQKKNENGGSTPLNPLLPGKGKKFLFTIAP